LRVLEEQRTQGILITPVRDDANALQRLRERGIAIVLLDRPSEREDLSSVAVDDVCGGEMAITHLLEQGHEYMAFVRGPLSIRQCADRLQGVERGLRAAGLDPARVLLDIATPTLTAKEGEACVERLLAAERTPTAVFCANDLLALGVMRGLRKRNLAVPADIALVGYDDVEFAAMLAPALTSIRQPKYQLGRAAAELLLREINNSPPYSYEQIVFQPELVVRESSVPVRR
ncbi:MAG: substrate-binding domain-containing protein, partial [Ktedonobacteraceae bacterium]|nr:substrate-binding domain-containing protein [Ktedonobacteraceae bacterium]